jgi:hypothetical protein
MQQEYRPKTDLEYFLENLQEEEKCLVRVRAGFEAKSEDKALSADDRRKASECVNIVDSELRGLQRVLWLAQLHNLLPRTDPYWTSKDRLGKGADR